MVRRPLVVRRINVRSRSWCESIELEPLFRLYTLECFRRLAWNTDEMVVVASHQPLSAGSSRGRHFVGLAAPRCPSCGSVLNAHRSTGVMSPMDRHLESPKASRCPMVVVASRGHQLVGTGSPTSRHLEGLAAPRCPFGVVVWRGHQPLECSTGRHLACLAAMQCP